MILRWDPRIWSVLLRIFSLAIIFSPDPYATGELIPAMDIILLGLWGASIVGLLIGWFDERLGAYVAIGTLIIREVLFIIVEGRWYVNFLLIWLVIFPPCCNVPALLEDGAETSWEQPLIISRQKLIR